MITLAEITATLGEKADELKALGVARLGVFGSFARGDATAESDIDFLVDLEHKAFDAYMDLKFFLEDLFDRPVDLVLSDSIKPRLRPRIESDVVYARRL